MKILPLTYMSTHYYLLFTDKATLLIDAGWPGTLGKFLHLLRSTNIRPETITHFFVTHYHPDHAGLTQELQDLGIRLIVFEEQVPAIPLLKQWIKPATGWKEISITKETIVITIADSRPLLQRLGLNGQCVHTPGHSDDSVSLVLDSGEAFIGDLPVPNFVGPASPRSSSFLTFASLGYPTSDNDDIPRSYAALKSLGVRTLYPAHGPSPIPLQP
jgi:glyoxylase-like metal-dependent hydrolase (beta-lactamase superfamily II)